MIKPLAIGGVVGLLFMTGGFFVGLRFVHVPAPKVAVAAAPTKAEVEKAARDAISVDALQKTSKGMMDMNQALQARELAVVAREKKAQQREDELDAERAALDRSHEKFHALYGEFQARLQLVQANEADQLQRQLAIYTTMDPAQTADLLRSLDDETIVRLFSMMETKPLANLVAAWKTKYPADSTRVLTALTRMGTVMPADKIALADSTTPSDANGAAAPAPAPPGGTASNSGDVAANPATPDSAPADASASSAPTSAPADMTSNAANSSSSDAAAPVASTATPDASQTAATDPGSNAAAPTADASSAAASAPAAPTSSATPDASGTDSSSSPAASAPATDSTPQAPAAPATPASPSLTPPPDTSSGHGAAVNPPASVPTDSPSLLGVPGATAAESAAIAQRRTGRLTADISTDRSY